MSLDNWGDPRSFMAVDFAGNRNLLAEAQQARVEKFVYVSLYAAESLLRTEYARAHERFAELLRGSGMPSTVIRPTRFFGFFAEILRMARKGRGIVIGRGTARTNPVHEADVAAVCAEAVHGAESEIAVGGPDIYSRREIVELALDVVGKTPRITRIPPWLFRSLVAPVRLVNPRLHALMAFGAAVSTVDVVAPAVGRRDLQTYFRSLVRQE
ncbi:MAG TPA: NAD(P)H-binding protein [Thermoanaerobaculia bacterium]|nr:NAD(P)H-binding protein [Thermoanaerobaculia bacterium]